MTLTASGNINLNGDTLEFTNGSTIRIPHGYSPEKFLVPKDLWKQMISDPHLTLPPEAPDDLPTLLDYFKEKGLQWTDWHAHPGMCSVRLHDLKPHYFNKVVVPELERRASKWGRRITYRFKTKAKRPRRVDVHIVFWVKDKRPEVIRYPVR